MLDIIALFFLCRIIGKLAVQKGLKAGTWRWYTILGWIGAEILGVMLSIGLFGLENLIAMLSIGIASAFGGYLLVKSALDRKPDTFDDEVLRSSVDDLHPPRKEI
ncbi:MAG: hypothetical protein ABIS01_04495 [Ferruginibacter sp.]